MGKKVKNLLRVFFPKKKKKKDVTTNNNGSNGSKKASVTKSSSVKASQEERRASSTVVNNNNPSTTQSAKKLNLIIDTTTNTTANNNNSNNNGATTTSPALTIGTVSTDILSVNPTLSSTSELEDCNTEVDGSEDNTPSCSTEEEYADTVPRSRTSTSTSGDLSFQRHLAADTITNDMDNSLIQQEELVSSAVFEETLVKLEKRTSAASGESFDETVDNHTQFNYKLENSVTETQLEYVAGGLYVEDDEEEVDDDKEVEGLSEVVKIEKVKEVHTMYDESCPSPIRGGGGCCSTLPEVTTMHSPLSDIEESSFPTRATIEAAFETSRSSRMEGVRAALEKATREEDDDDDEGIESPPSPAISAAEELPNEKVEKVVMSSSTNISSVDGGKSSSTEALAWTALSALMTAPAPYAVQQNKTRTPTNLWQHGELDELGEVESDIDNISIACSSIADMSLRDADISLRDDNVDGSYIMDLGVGVGGVEVVADDDIAPQVEEDKAANVVESVVNQSIESNESSTTTTSSSTAKAKKPKKVQFSLRGEQARKRAIARQKKILSKASLRLGAISETSLENIEEHDQLLNVTTGIDDDGDSVGVSSSMPSLSFACDSSMPSLSFAGDTDMESIMEGSELASIGGEFNNDCSSSVRSVVSHQVIGEGKGGICSISFYEAASEGNKKLLDNSNELLVEGESTKNEVAESAVAEEKVVDDDMAVQGDVIPSSTAEVQADVAQVVDITNKDSDKQEKECIGFFVLLLCPTSRIFELVEIKDAKLNSTVQDIMDSIPQQCTDERLLSKSYTGFVRPTDRIEFMQMGTKVFEKHQQSQLRGGNDDENLKTSNIIQEDDVLVAILEGYSGYQMIKISKPILKNSKFRDMLCRRSKNGGTPQKISTRRSSAGGSDDKSARSSRSVRSSHSRRKRHNRGKRRSGGSSRRGSDGGKTHPDDFINSEIAAGKSRSSSSSNKSSSKYSSITQKLEDLSKKLHDVDDEIEADDQSVASGTKLSSTPEKAPLVKDDDMEEDEATIAASILEEVSSTANLSCYKMTPKMVAYELASNIEDIFADHDVDIVAVDSYNADFNLEDDDNLTKGSNDDTFVSARSMLNMSDARSIRSLAREFNSSSPVKPVLEITTKKKRERKSKPSKFSNYEEDDMMLQIEAMARQADVAFESRKKMSNLWDDAGTSSTNKKPITVSREKLAAAVSTTDVDVMEGAKIDSTVLKKKKSHEDTDSKVKAVVSQEDNKEVAGITAGNITSAMVKRDDTKTTSPNTSSSERTFLNTSTSMVSTMVAASQGRVNEVHVLQYLGVTIVCIAANFMQHTRKAAGGGTRGKDSSFVPKTVLESAMFLAFMVNGQRYMAKVTKKSGNDN